MKVLLVSSGITTDGVRVVSQYTSEIVKFLRRIKTKISIRGIKSLKKRIASTRMNKGG